MENCEAPFSFYTYSQESFEDSCILVCILKKQAWFYKLSSSELNEHIFSFTHSWKRLKCNKTLKNYFI